MKRRKCELCYTPAANLSPHWYWQNRENQGTQGTQSTSYFVLPIILLVMIAIFFLERKFQNTEQENPSLEGDLNKQTKMLFQIFTD